MKPHSWIWLISQITPYRLTVPIKVFNKSEIKLFVKISVQRLSGCLVQLSDYDRVSKIQKNTQSKTKKYFKFLESQRHYVDNLEKPFHLTSVKKAINLVVQRTSLTYNFKGIHHLWLLKVLWLYYNEHEQSFLSFFLFFFFNFHANWGKVAGNFLILWQ